ncbi:MAG TPA: tannase/feruloyl esterase family alpha/beta hydrolase [Pseudonocardiaceae bacterium]|nr:tannase/feruloyl esterase family alpha/beta hydrolase [Pseudonocardiaceae bacterium]
MAALSHLWSTRRRPLLACAALLVVLVSAGVGSAVAANPSPQGLVTPVVDCAGLLGEDFTHVPDAPSRLVSATVDQANGQAYCDVWGYTSPQTYFEVKLPTTNWHGDYLQEGCGGFCGQGPLTNLPGASAGCAPATNGELVLAADDEGHLTSSGVDGLWARDDPALRLVFGRTSEHSLAKVAKALIQRYYDRPVAHSYFDGCSDGGREALMLAQRYPTDFNGIIAGAPAQNWAPLGGFYETWLARANTGADGYQVLTQEKLPALHAAVVKACGNADGVIADPRKCAFDPGTLTCPAGQDKATCLTPAQVKTVRELYQGPRDPAGRSLYNGGEPYGSELAWQDWLVKPAADTAAPGDTEAGQLALNYLKYMAFTDNPPDSFTLKDLPFTDAEFAKLEKLGKTLYDANDPDLSAFAAHGGKLIIYHGWADQAISPWSTLDYYAQVERTAGGFAASQRFTRLYMVPNGNHCLTGPDNTVNLDLLTPLMNWVTKGAGPGAVAAPITWTKGAVTRQTVRPYNALTPVTPAPGSLNGHYDYIGN